MILLNRHNSVDTAHITFDYPFGRSVRCVRREWIERAEKGSARGQYRFVTQTTAKPFNIEYTQWIRERGVVFANMHAVDFVQSGKMRWNAPKASVYMDFMVMVEAPLDDGSGRIGVSHIGLSGYAGPTRIQNFKNAMRGQLTPEQAAQLDMLERIGRKVDQSSWAAYDAKRATA